MGCWDLRRRVSDFPSLTLATGLTFRKPDFTIVANDAILVSQDKLDGIGRSLCDMRKKHDAASNQRTCERLTANILEITGREEFDVTEKTTEFEAKRIAGETFEVSRENLEEYNNSLGVFMWGLIEHDDDEEIEINNGDEAIHLTTRIQRWDQEESEGELGGRVLYLSRSVLRQKFREMMEK